MDREITEFEKNIHWVYTPLHRDDMPKTPTIDERKSMLGDYAANRLQKDIEKYYALILLLGNAQQEILKTADNLSIDTVVEDLTKLKSTFENTQRTIADVDYDNRYAKTILSRAPKIYD